MSTGIGSGSVRPVRIGLAVASILLAVGLLALGLPRLLGVGWSEIATTLGAIPAAPGQGKYADNGISEMLSVGPTRLLTLERSGVENDAGVFHTYVRIYEIDTRGATDVSSLPTLAGATFQPVSKRLVLDLNAINLPAVDNLEGMAFGPVLPNGHASLVLISDDNFSNKQVTQLLVFEVIP